MGRGKSKEKEIMAKLLGEGRGRGRGRVVTGRRSLGGELMDLWGEKKGIGCHSFRRESHSPLSLTLTLSLFLLLYLSLSFSLSLSLPLFLSLSLFLSPLDHPYSPILEMLMLSSRRPFIREEQKDICLSQNLGNTKIIFTFAQNMLATSQINRTMLTLTRKSVQNSNQHELFGEWNTIVIKQKIILNGVICIIFNFQKISSSTNK